MMNEIGAAKINFKTSTFIGGNVLTKSSTVTFVPADGNPGTANKMAMAFAENIRTDLMVNDSYHVDPGLIQPCEYYDDVVIPFEIPKVNLPAKKVEDDTVASYDIDACFVNKKNNGNSDEVYTKEFLTPDGTGIVRVVTNDPEKAEAKLKAAGFKF